MAESFDAAVSRVARKQQRNITREQLLAIGVTSNGITCRVRAGRLHRTRFPGVYTVGTPALTPHERAYSAILACGPSAILATRIHGESPFKGYRMTCFTNDEEEGVGLASRVTWLLETELKDKIGVEFSRGEIWKPYMVEDRNLITGQNPDSAAVLGERLLELLK